MVVGALPEAVLLCVANCLGDHDLGRAATAAKEWHAWVLSGAAAVAPFHNFGARLTLLDWHPRRRLARGASAAPESSSSISSRGAGGGGNTQAGSAHANGAAGAVAGAGGVVVVSAVPALTVACEEEGPPVDFETFESKEKWEHDHNVRCERCGFGGEILCCDFCNLVWHMGCLDPPLEEEPPEGRRERPGVV